MTSDQRFIEFREQLRQFGKNAIEGQFPDLIRPHFTEQLDTFTHERLRRLVQIVQDLATKPIAECSLLDLGCLDGFLAMEFAMQGADTTGLEVRPQNVLQGEILKSALTLHNMTFVVEDVRKITNLGPLTFDVILCSGLLYHLTAADAIELLSNMYKMTERLAIIDTHVALRSDVEVHVGESKFYGHFFTEHAEGDSEETKAARNWASWGNEHSFWFTKESLLNLLTMVGFNSVLEVQTPVMTYPLGADPVSTRVTLVAIKSPFANVISAPAMDGKRLLYREGEILKLH